MCYMYGLSGFVKNLNSADMLNVQNVLNCAKSFESKYDFVKVFAKNTYMTSSLNEMLI